MDMEIIRFTPGKLTEKSPLLKTVNQPIPATPSNPSSNPTSNAAVRKKPMFMERSTMLLMSESIISTGAFSIAM